MKTQLLVLLLSVLIGLSGCQCLEQYNQARDAFSRGATLDNRQLLGEGNVPGDVVVWDDFYRRQTNAGLPAGARADDFYALAVERINRSLRCDGQLREQEVLANAYIIQALAEWQLRHYGRATAAAADARNAFRGTDKESPRDRALAVAIDGLVFIDSAYQNLRPFVGANSSATLDNFPADTTQRNQQYAQLRRFYESRVEPSGDTAVSIARGLLILDNAIKNTTEQDSVVLYLRNAQLAGLRTWQESVDLLITTGQRLGVFRRRPAEAAWIEKEQAELDEQIRKYMGQLEAVLPNGRQNGVYRFWEERM